MLGKRPNPNKLSGKVAPAGGLWIRRVLVRAQEGQYGRRKRGRFCCGLGLRTLPVLRLEPRRGNGRCSCTGRLFGARKAEVIAEGQRDVALWPIGRDAYTGA
jgi:hypothetical protein